MKLLSLTCILSTLMLPIACGQVEQNQEVEPDAGAGAVNDAAFPDVDAAGDMAPDAGLAEPDAGPIVCGNECESAGGTCHLGECMQPFDLGFPNAFGDNIGGPLPSFIWGFSIEVEATSFVTGLGFIAMPHSQEGNTADAHIALYRDEGGSPTDLIVAMDEILNMPNSVVTTFDEELSAPIVLEPGTYWLMGKAQSNISPFASNNNGVPPSFPMAFVTADSSQPFPPSLTNVSLANNHAPNFFLSLIAPD